jgi:hypothetical protein
MREDMRELHESEEEMRGSEGACRGEELGKGEREWSERGVEASEGK